jgi:hypothetical protein
VDSYSDNACATATFTFRAVATYTGGTSVDSPAGAKQIDVSVTKLVFNVKTDDFVAAFNGTHAGGGTAICGGGFVKDTDKELSASNCANDAVYKSFFGTQYSIYKIDGSKMYDGDCEGANDCTTAAKRSTTLSTEYVTKS